MRVRRGMIPVPEFVAEYIATISRLARMARILHVAYAEEIPTVVEALERAEDVEFIDHGVVVRLFEFREQIR